MKRIILGLLVFVLIFQIFLIKNVYASNGKGTVTITGKVKMVSIDDAWMVVKTENGLVLKIWNAFKKLIGGNPETINEYRINIMSNTKIESSLGEEVFLENITVGETVNVTGILLENMTKTESGLIEAQYIKVLRSKAMITVITNFFNFNQGVSTVGVGQSNSEVVTNNLEKQFGIGVLPTKPKIFKNNECISEGEPILVNGLFAPKTNDKCCDGLKECLLSGFKSNGSMYSSDSVVELNGFSYIVKGYCRKECSEDVSDSGNKNQFGLLIPGLPEIPRLPIAKQCMTDQDCLSSQKCINGVCVTKNGIVSNFGSNKYCITSNDCVFNGYDCESRGFGIVDSMFDLFRSNSNQCACINNICSIALQMPSERNFNTINCDSEIFKVCGTDGKTYNNPCEALRAGIQIQCNKQCPCEVAKGFIEPPSNPVQPGKCGSASDCMVCGDECFEGTMLKNSGQVCGKTTIKNLGCDCQNGNCMLSVFSCGDIVDFVCGIDGKTYKNKCAANDAGVGIECNRVCPCTTIPAKPLLITPDTGASKLKDIIVNGFCGTQTETFCSQDSDCMVGGCSGEICQARKDNMMNSICLFEDCYQKPTNVYCGCDSGQCKWYSAKTSSSISSTLPKINTEIINTIIQPVLTPPVLIPPVVVSPGNTLTPSLPGDTSGRQICMMVMMCLNGRVHTADCGETGNRCYVFQETGNGNCYCVQ